MSIDKKKLAAITAAVFTYIKTQEEAQSAQINMPTDLIDSSGVTSDYSNFSLWGYAGRSAQMQMRSMMQIRAFKN